MSATEVARSQLIFLHSGHQRGHVVAHHRFIRGSRPVGAGEGIAVEARADAGAPALNTVQLAAMLDVSHRELTRALASLARQGRASSGRLGWSPAPALPGS